MYVFWDETGQRIYFGNPLQTEKKTSVSTPTPEAQTTPETSSPVSQVVDPRLVFVSIFQLVYSVAALLLGLLCVVVGATLSLNSVGGNVTWSLNLAGASSKLSSAPQGVVLFVVGLFVVWVGRFRVKFKSR
jgi:hypothetical protein